MPLVTLQPNVEAAAAHRSASSEGTDTTAADGGFPATGAAYVIIYITGSVDTRAQIGGAASVFAGAYIEYRLTTGGTWFIAWQQEAAVFGSGDDNPAIDSRTLHFNPVLGFLPDISGIDVRARAVVHADGGPGGSATTADAIITDWEIVVETPGGGIIIQA